MKYCVDYSRKSTVLDKADEINLRYTPRKEFVTYIQEHAAQKINIVINNSDMSLDDFYSNIDTIIKIRNKYQFENIAVRITIYDKNVDLALEKLKDADIPYYFVEYVNNLETLHMYVSLGVSEVYISGSLGFDLKDISKYLHSKNIKIRVYPNIAQSDNNFIPDILKFFIRPEDIEEVYDNYIDVCEFWGKTERVNVAFDAYKKGEWFGNLNTLLLNFSDDCDNRSMLKIFGRSRIICDRRCLKGKNCTICENAKQLANDLAQNNIYTK